MANRFKGAVSVEGLGELRYDHNSLAELFDQFGGDWPAKFTTAQLENDVRTVDQFAAVGCDKTAEEIMKISPPFVKLCEGITEAINIAFNGTEKPEATQDAKENPPKSRTGNGSLHEGSKPLAASASDRVTSGP